MRYLHFVGLSFVGAFASGASVAAVDASAVDCRIVVAQTLEEMELADPQWSIQHAQVARQAAASACLKVQRRLASAEHGSADSVDEEGPEDDDLGSFLGMPRNKQSGGLHGKPYERRR